MFNKITLMLFIIKSCLGDYSIIQTQYGCKVATQSPCLELCIVGVEDCQSVIPECEYGYFLFTLQSPATCVQCPYQDVVDLLNLYCMDCVENPYTWEFSRKCTYDYQVKNGDINYGTYIPYQPLFTELFFIGLATDPGVTDLPIFRSLAIPYAVYDCSGCDSFCVPNIDTGCNAIQHSYILVDTDKNGVTCLEGYHFKGNQCQACIELHCRSCSPEKCLACDEGYTPTIDSQSCMPCMDNCLDCSRYKGQLVCNKCDRSDPENYYVESLDRTTCDGCGEGCARCEYISYSSQVVHKQPTRNGAYVTDFLDKYILRCRQCTEFTFTMSYTGDACEPCFIRNCQKCYYQIRPGVTTLDLDFEPPRDTEPTPQQMCFKCNNGFYLTENQLQCNDQSGIPLASKIQNCQLYQVVAGKYVCTLCAQGFIFDKELNGCFGECTQYIANCKYCYSYSSLNQKTYVDSSGILQTQKAQQLFQCQQCDDGYYPDFFTGKCVACQSNCKSCWQYTQTYNFTDYLGLQKVVDDDTKAMYLDFDQEDPFCSLCSVGYNWYSNKCLGCSSNCVVTNPNIIPGQMGTELLHICTYQSKSAFCGQCYQSNLDRSLKADQSECHECPNNCVACRDRTTQEANKINPYFSPNNEKLLKYGKLCYLMQQQLIGTEQTDYIATLNMPITCSYTSIVGQTQKCRKTAQASVSLYCDQTEYDTAFNSATTDQQRYIYIIDDFFLIESQLIATIEFTKLETYSIFQQLNDAVVEEMKFTVNIIQNTLSIDPIDKKSKRICTFPKTTNFKSQFQQNVFSLRKFKLIIVSSTTDGSLIQLNVGGSIKFPGMSEIVLKGFDIRHSIGLGYSEHFGLEVDKNNLSRLSLENINIGRHESQTAKFQFIVNNMELLSLTDVTFYSLGSSHTFDFVYDLQNLTNQTLYLNGVSFVQLHFLSMVLFNLNEIPTSTINFIVGPKGLNFDQCVFNDTTLIGEDETSQLPSGKTQIDKLSFKFCAFRNSSFLKLRTQNITSIRNLDIIQTSFLNTIFIKSNAFTIENSYIYMVNFQNSSRLFQTVGKIPEILSVGMALKLFTFSNIKVKDCICAVQNCIMLIQTPGNFYNLVSNVIINNMQIQNTETFALSQKQSYSVSAAMIYLSNLDKIRIKGFISNANMGVTIISVSGCSSFRLQNGLYDWNTQQIGQQPPDPWDQTALFGNTILYPANNKIPTSIDCSSRKVVYKSFSQLFIYLSHFTYGVSIEDVTIRRQLSVDTSFIQIKSWRSEQVNTTSDTPFEAGEFYSGLQNEYIRISNVKFIGNSLTISQPLLGVSQIDIRSDQKQIIAISGCQFIDNHLHTLVADTIAASTPTMYIQSASSDVSITDTLFRQNRQTQTKYPMLIIISNTITMLRCNFTETNIQTVQWHDRLEESQLFASDDVQTQYNLAAFFQVLSEGGNALLQASDITISGCSLIDCHAIYAAGLLIKLIDEGNLLINNTIFTNQINNLESEYMSNGGCLYIDSSGSLLNLTLNQVKMNNCVTRSEGGCIYLNPSTLESTVIIQQSEFIKCQGLLVSAISAKFSTASIIMPEVQIIDSKFSNNDMNNLLHNVPTLGDNELNGFGTSASVYYQIYGKLIMRLVFFDSYKYTSILYLTEMIDITFNDVSVSYNTILINPLVFINLYDSIGKLIITKSSFSKNNQYQAMSETEFNKVYPSKCIIYITNPASYTLVEQQCQNVKDAMTLFNSIISLAAETAISTYSLESNQYYESMSPSNKYELPTIYPDSSVTFEVVQPYSITASFLRLKLLTNDQLLAFRLCYITYIYRQLTKSTSTTFNTGLVYVTKVNNVHTVILQSIDLEDNTCLGCLNGLFQITNIVPTFPATIRMLDINCQDNVIGYYGCFSITSEAKITEFILQFPIANVSVPNHRRILSTLDDLIKLNYTAVIDKSRFSQNTAKIGTGISSVGLDILISQCDFSDNYATLIGGAVFFRSITTNTAQYQTLLQYDNSYQNNIAQIAGAVFVNGAAMGDQTQLLLDFDSNSGTSRGNNIEEKPQKLTISMKSNKYIPTKTYLEYDGDHDKDHYIDNTTTTIIDIVDLTLYQLPNYNEYTKYLLLPSGQPVNDYKYYYLYTEEQVPYEWQFRIINLNRFKEPMSNADASSKCEISGRMMDELNLNDTIPFLSNYTRISSYHFDKSAGAFVMDSIIVIFDPLSPPNLYLQLKFECNSVQIPVYSRVSPYNIIGYNANYALLVNIRTFPCQLGEVYNQMMCKACLQVDNAYAVTLNQEQCNTIDSSTMDSVSPVAIKVKPGYYRVEYDYPQVVYCENMAINCNGGWKSGNPSCYTGHLGALCESCDVYNVRGDEVYSTSGSFQCGPCAGTTTANSIVISAMTVFTVVSITLSVKGNYQMLEDYVKNLRRISMGALISMEASNLSILIKLFTNYFQIISALGTFRLSFPTSLSSTAQVAGNPTKSMMYSSDCFLVGLTNIDLLYFRMIWALVTPAVHLVIFLLGYLIAVLIGQAPYKIGILYTTFIYMFIYLQPSLVGELISLASTRDVGGAQFVQSDVAYRYDSPTHQYWLVVFVLPVLFVWAILFPCLFFILVYRIRNTLDDIQNRRKLGFFYNEYTKQGYFWEFVKIFQKELIIIFLTYYEARIVVKGLITFLIVFFYGGFTMSFDPYTSNRLNFIDRLSTAICAASLCLGVLIYSTIKEGLTYLTIIMFLVIGIINIYFILLMVYYLLEGYVVQFQPQLDKVRDMIRTKYPNIGENRPWLRRALTNKTEMNIRIKAHWAFLRYSVRQGIKRRRSDPHAPLIVRVQLHIDNCVSDEDDLHSDHKAQLVPTKQLNKKHTIKQTSKVG